MSRKHVNANTYFNLFWNFEIAFFFLFSKIESVPWPPHTSSIRRLPPVHEGYSKKRMTRIIPFDFSKLGVQVSETDHASSWFLKPNRSTHIVTFWSRTNRALATSLQGNPAQTASLTCGMEAHPADHSTTSQIFTTRKKSKLKSGCISVFLAEDGYIRLVHVSLRAKDLNSWRSQP
jgi:hypothetical protein